MKELLTWLQEQAKAADEEAVRINIEFPHAASMQMGKAVAFRQTAAKIEEDAKAAHAENMAALNKPQVQI